VKGGDVHLLSYASGRFAYKSAFLIVAFVRGEINPALRFTASWAGIRRTVGAFTQKLLKWGLKRNGSF